MCRKLSRLIYPLSRVGLTRQEMLTAQIQQFVHFRTRWSSSKFVSGITPDGEHSRQLATWEKRDSNCHVPRKTNMHTCRNMWKICQGQEIRFKKKKEREKKRKASAVPREIVIIALSGYMPLWAQVEGSRVVGKRSEGLCGVLVGSRRYGCPTCKLRE
ncbi:Uncharacterized protein HZ326_0688 [Fusarium oxysporum f. sp. albedinis]|nr:Uncharacterized protein HZ326_0688 [Fusarium oxysporum f. sp. albedinis]